jgi:MFS family permease
MQNQSSEGQMDPSSDDRPSWRRLPRNVWAVTATSFLTDTSTEMITNLLPLFMFNVLGIHTALIGVIEGVAQSTASVLKLFSGWLSDRLGVRKSLAVAGYGLSTISKPLLYFATNWLWVLGVRFGDRMGKGLRTAPRDALVADSVDEKQRGLAFGLHRAGDTAGAVLGITIALLVLWLSRRGPVEFSRSTFQRIVLISVIPALLAVIILAFAAREVEPERPEAQAPELRLKPLGRSFQIFLLILVIFTLGNSSDAFLILRAERAGLTPMGILGMMITFNLVYAGLSTPAGALSDRVGRKRLLVAGWLLYGLVYLGFALAGAGWQAWALMVPYGAYYGLTEGTARAFVADLVPLHLRGTAYGVYNAAVGITVLPASAIAGLLWQGVGPWGGFGPSAPFLFGSVLAIVAAIALILLQLTPGQEPVSSSASR